MINAFAPWIPMYNNRAIPERPWWRYEVGPEFTLQLVRSDGNCIQSPERYAGCPEELPLIDAHDAANPVPAPSPMVGQVWAGAVGEATIVGRLGSRLWWFGPPVAGPDGPAVWPPAGAVLVAGPTPWGRDVPWVPAGFKP